MPLGRALFLCKATNGQVPAAGSKRSSSSNSLACVARPVSFDKIQSFPFHVPYSHLSLQAQVTFHFLLHLRPLRFSEGLLCPLLSLSILYLRGHISCTCSTVCPLSSHAGCKRSWSYLIHTFSLTVSSVCLQVIELLLGKRPLLTGFVKTQQQFECILMFFFLLL